MNTFNPVNDISLFNAIRNVSSLNFQSRIPKADAISINTLKQQMLNSAFQPEYNEWLKNLIDRIGLTLFRDNKLTNRLARFRMSEMEYGMYVQEISMQVISGADYNMPDNGGTLDPFKVSNPDVKQLMYQLNSKRIYPVTINQDLVRRAFTNEGGLSTLIPLIMSNLIKGSDLDDWYSCKELFNQFIQGTSNVLPKNPEQVVTVAGYDNEANAKSTITTIKQTATDMGFPRGKYNEAGIIQMVEPLDLCLFIRQEAVNYLDTNVLAFAFNRGDLNFTPNDSNGFMEMELMDDFGGVYAVDSSGNKLFPIYNADGSTTNKYSATEGGTTPVTVDKFVDPNADVLAVLIDKRRLMIINNNLRQEQIWNPSGLYTNMFLHNWNLFAMSGALNGVIFKVQTP